MNHSITKYTLALVATATFSAFAQDSMITIPKPDVSKELEAFEVADGFEVNLFASDPMIANPIHMNFDSIGRLWVAGSAVYPHIAPGQEANDVITVLEDTDGDGVADKSTIFADGLFIPTGILPGDGGVYVANSTELLHMKDTDGDLHVDEIRVVLSGFGTEDTHHIIHTLRWGYDGLMYFNQSIYIHSHIETPHGVRRLNAGGIWAFRPDTMELEVFALGLVNAWGHHFDQWGQHFATDGAGGHGINYMFPGAAYMTAYNMPRVLQGLNPGQPKHASLEILSGRHLPEDWRGTMVTNDFRGHRVNRFLVTDEAAGYSSVEQPEILTSSHVAFRPVDVKMGPDGAIYLADWYNPIIQHGEVDFRDPRRDHEHGRIWRVQAKDRPLLVQPDFKKASIDELIEIVQAPEEWNQIHAKRELKIRNRDEVLAKLNAILESLPEDKDKNVLLRLQLLWIYQTLDEASLRPLAHVTRSSDYRSRAAGIRVLSEWKDKLDLSDDDYRGGLSDLATDGHSRVRLEAVRALARLGDAQAFDEAMGAYKSDMDKFLEYALWTTVREMKQAWLPEAEAGNLRFTEDNDAYIYALRAIDSNEAVPQLLTLFASDDLSAKQQRDAMAGIAAHGSRVELGTAAERIFSIQKTVESHRIALLNALVSASKRRSVRVKGDFDALGEGLDSGSDAMRIASLKAIGAWKLTQLCPAVEKILGAKKTPESVRDAAMTALAGIGDENTVEILAKYAGRRNDTATRTAAIRAMLEVSVDDASEHAADLFTEDVAPDPSSLVRDFLKADGGAKALATALKGKTMSAENAKRAERVVSASGRKQNVLLMALRTSGALDDGAPELTKKEMAALVEKVQTKGNARRGRKHFRKLDCYQCHALAGAGGTLGPEMTSIGASAQIDYLIESNYYPDKAIKEGYHSLLVDMKDGDFISGIKVTETNTELILRNALESEIRIPIANIAMREDGGSLMPTGLGDSLLEDEFVDLVRFLSELGRTPEFSAGTGRHVRTWRVLENSEAARDYLYEAQVEAAVGEHETMVWVPEYSYITGEIPMSEVPGLKHRYWPTRYSFLKFSVNAPSDGKAALTIAPVEGVQLYQGEQEVNIGDDGSVLLDLASGATQCTVIVNRDIVKGDLDVQLVESSETTVTATFNN